MKEDDPMPKILLGMPTRAGAESAYHALEKVYGKSIVMRFGNGGGLNWDVNLKEAIIVVSTNGWLKAKLLPFNKSEERICEEFGNVQVIILDEYHLRYSIVKFEALFFYDDDTIS